MQQQSFLLGMPLVLAAVLLVACPESPPDVNEAGETTEGPTAGPAAGPASAGPPGADGVAPPPPGAGSAGNAPELDPEMENPQHTQEDLADDGDAVTVKGEIICKDGSGPYRVRLFVPPPDLGGPDAENEEAGPPSPLVNVAFESEGAFSFRTPKGVALVVLAYEDLDNNGLPTLEEPQFGPLKGNPVALQADVDGLTLDCSKPLPAPEPQFDADSLQPADGAEIEGGPPVDAVPAASDGPPPEGGALLPADGAEGPPPSDLQVDAPPPE